MLLKKVENDLSPECGQEQGYITPGDAGPYWNLLDDARRFFAVGNYNQALDLYERLSMVLPNQAIEILAELYDQYQKIPHKDRYLLYQSRFYHFDIQPTDKVLDVGSGNLPFQHATHLADITIEDNAYGRAGVPFRYLEGRPVFECNMEKLPFEDNEFDFVYCSHVLEHVQYPEKACTELIRIAKRGYIEAPTRGKDIWLNTAKISNHRWAIENDHHKLIFTEYTAEDIEGLQNDILLNMHVAPQTIREKAFSALIYLKADKLNTMLLWQDAFEFEVRRAGQPRLHINGTHEKKEFAMHTKVYPKPTTDRGLNEAYDKLWQMKLGDREWLKQDGKGRVEYCANILRAHHKVFKGARLLDIGCGRGTLAHYLDPGADLYGIDISQTALKEAAKFYSQTARVDLDRQRLPYENDFFDIAVALDVIEHVFDPFCLLQEVYRVLKPKGELILSTPNILFDEHLKYLVRSRKFPKTSGDTFPYDGGHIHFFTYQDMRDLMNGIGFEALPIGPLKENFDFEFKEPMVWLLGKK